MVLTHRQLTSPQKDSVALAKCRVTQPLGVLLEVLLVQQLERHARPPSLAVDPGAVGLDTRLARYRHLRALVEPRLELVLAQWLDGSPTAQAGLGGPRQHAADRAGADPDATGGVAIREPKLQFQTKNLSCLAHRQSLSSHSTSVEAGWLPNQLPSSLTPPRGPSVARCPAGPPGRRSQRRSWRSRCRSRRSRCPNLGDHDADPGDHDAPILLITMRRSR
jgi:hypothetical protein